MLKMNFTNLTKNSSININFIDKKKSVKQRTPAACERKYLKLCEIVKKRSESKKSWKIIIPKVTKS